MGRPRAARTHHPARRWDRERAVWADGATSFYTVSAWRALGANL
ncbi:single-stranded DNA-binding protein, partial [Streptomyces roseolus]